MGQDRITTLEKDLQQIAEMLVLNGTLTECSSLVHGKIGIAIFFFHYAQHTGNELFADYAMDLIGEMMNQIHVNSPADYEKGISGIGVGFDYLIRNNFLNVEDDICEDFDDRMYRAVMHDPWQDFSQYIGLTGFGRYWIIRLRYPAPSVQARECLLRIIALIKERLPEISIKEQTDVYCFLHDLYGISGFESCIGLLEALSRHFALDAESPVSSSPYYHEIAGQARNDGQPFPRLGNSIVGNIARMYQRNRYFKDALQETIDNALMQIPALDMEKAPTGTGLLNGYAGEGLIRLTTLNPANMEWMFLL